MRRAFPGQLVQRRGHDLFTLLRFRLRSDYRHHWRAFPRPASRCVRVLFTRKGTPPSHLRSSTSDYISHKNGVAFIAGFKLVKGFLLLLVGLGLLNLVHAEIAMLFSLLIEALHVHADSRILHALVLRVDALQPHTVLVMGVISLGYAGLMLIEGVGYGLRPRGPRISL